MLKTQICIAMTDVPKNEPERNLSSAASYPVGLGLRGNNLPGSFHVTTLPRRTEAFG